MSSTYEFFAKLAQTWGLVYSPSMFLAVVTYALGHRALASGNSTKPRASRCGRTKACSLGKNIRQTACSDRNNRPRMGRYPGTEYAVAALVAVAVLRDHRLVIGYRIVYPRGPCDVVQRRDYSIGTRAGSSPRSLRPSKRSADR